MIRRDKQILLLVISLNIILWVSVSMVIYYLSVNPYLVTILASSFTGYTLFILYRRSKRKLILGKVIEVMEVKIPLAIRLPFYPHAGIDFRLFRTTILDGNNKIIYYDFERRDVGDVVIALLDYLNRVIAVNRRKEKITLEKLTQLVNRL